MAASGFCRRCGTRRLGNFRFCRTCRYDFEAPLHASAVESSAETPPAAEKPRVVPTPEPGPHPMPSISLPRMPGRAVAWGAAGAVTVLALIVVLQGGPWSSERPGAVAGTVSPDLPPPGTVWFGRAFDASTFEMPARVPTARTGESIAYVARLTRAGSGLTVRTVIGGVRATPREVDVSDEPDIVGGILELSVVGPLSIEILDGTGAVLASGTFMVTD